VVFDVRRQIYIPVAWALMTGKISECYWQVFNWITLSVQDLDTSCIGDDFECAFFFIVVLHFPEAKIIGCLFHLKQVARRKMKHLRFPDKEVNFAMRKGVFDFLTLIPLKYLTLGIGLVQT
jgi:hypothetical protein